VRIIKGAFLVQAVADSPKAASYLEAWRKIVKASKWKSLIDVRKTYPSADGVKVRSGRNVTVFNVCGNEFRLIAAIHFDRQLVFMLRFLTHAQYSENKWKEEL
jgi:mRNA interferase HigB